jgi:DNA-binding FadR family transcriptional regulator
LAIADRSHHTEQWRTHVLRFHSTVLRASRNPFYARVVPLLQVLYTAEQGMITDQRTAALQCYAETAGAIQRGDATAAARHMSRTIATFAEP